MDCETGRKSYETFDDVPYGVSSPRLKVPAGLPDAEMRVFVGLVTGAPASQFQQTDLPLLARYAELVVLAERAAEGLRREPLVTTDGKLSPWVSIHATAVKGVCTLALKLRLSPQGRAPKAPKRLASPLSYYDTPGPGGR